MARSVDPQKYLSADELRSVKQAVMDAEDRTTAEIRIVLTRFCWGDIRNKASKVFIENGLHQTRDRNAVLILLVTTNREFLIYGDEGIHQYVGVDGWTEISNAMLEHFRNDRMSEGLCAGARMVGELLAAHFPFQADDVNELPDEVVFDVR